MALGVFILNKENNMLAYFVTLPDEAKILILGFFTSLFTAFFAYVFTRWGIDLRGFAAELAAVLAAIVVTLFEFGLKLLAFIPDQILLTIIHLILLALAGVGTAFVLNRRRTPGYRSVR